MKEIIPSCEHAAVRRLLEGTDPLPTLELRAEAAPAPDAMVLLARIKAATADQRPPRVPISLEAWSSRGRRTQWLVGVAATAAAGIVAVGLAFGPWLHPAVAQAVETPPMLDYTLGGDSRFLSTAGAPAGAVLTELARVAAERMDDPAAVSAPVFTERLHSVQWSYVVLVDELASASAVVPSDVEMVVDPDGTVHRSEHSGSPLQASGRLKKLTKQTGTPDEETFSPSWRSPRVLDAVPDSELRATLLADKECSERRLAPVLCLIEEVSDVHRRGVVDGSLEARLWAMLAEEPGVVSLGQVTDRAGRRGVAFTLARSIDVPVRPVLVVDPDTGRLLGVEEVVMRADAGYPVKAPAVVGFSTFLEAERVPAGTS